MSLKKIEDWYDSATPEEREARFPNKSGSISNRSVAAATGVGHATVARYAKGENIKLSTAKALLSVLKDCPCCGNPTK